MKKTLILCLTFLSLTSVIKSQNSISISIDDIPNVNLDSVYHSKLLDKLDSLNIPISIFINEGRILESNSPAKKFEILKNWISRDYVTIGNHTCYHSRYSEVGIDSFIHEIENGEFITMAIAKKYNKGLKYFRFPYNDLGKDSSQHSQVSNYLSSHGYTIAPFTVESEDWVFNSVYEYYLKNNLINEAEKVGFEYVAYTIKCLLFFEQLSERLYGQKIPHIYMCHDNKLNADFIHILINALKQEKYKFIDLNNTMNHPIYSKKDIFYKKWGISWLYRWKSMAEIKKVQLEEPVNPYYKIYKDLKL